MKVEYCEDTNTVILRFPDQGVFMGLPADHHILGLWRHLGIPKYQKWLWEKQDRKCAECSKSLPQSRGKGAYLHHDPPLGSEGSKAVDYKGTTKNRVLCQECHKKYHRKAKSSSIRMN